jgi:hypothetical protein
VRLMLRYRMSSARFETGSDFEHENHGGDQIA